MIFHPLFCYAELLSDYFILRLLFVALYFSSLFIVAQYWSRLVKADVFVPMVLLLVSLQILDYHNLPPNSYNIAFTLPFFVLLCARCAVLKLDGALDTASRPWLVVLSTAIFLSYLASDYVIIFGASMLIMEYFLAFVRSEGGAMVRLKALARRKKTFFDLLPIVLAGLAYFGWRLFFPPLYDGITVAKEFDPLLIVKTALTHASGGFSLARKDLYEVSLSMHSLPVGFFFSLFCTFLCSAVLAATSIFHLRGLAQGKRILAACLFLSLFITLPLALTPKYQQLQLKNMPAYVDSRFAYFWGVAALASLVCLVGSLLGEGKRRMLLSGVFGLLIGSASAFSYCHNVDMCQVMLDHAAVWDRARGIALASNAEKLLQEGNLTSRIDPFSLVQVHPGFDTESYWRKYIAWYGQRKSDIFLNWNPRLYPQLPVNFKPGILYALAEQPKRFFGRNGWFLLEHKVAFSSGDRAFVTFLTDNSMAGAILAFSASAYLAPGETNKKAEIRLNGKLLQSVLLYEEPRVFTIDIHGDMLQEKSATFEFIVEHAISPAAYGSQDSRRLGFGLWNIVLVQH